jgi:predicted RNA-binding protein with RPS1 domain
MSWTRRINHPSEVVQKGDEVEAVITSIDVVNQRISLSMKELLPNEWEEYANAHGVGDIATGKITNVTDFGVFVELAPGVEGLCHISEIDRDEGLALAEMFGAGQAVRCRILRVDWHESRIGLSMHAVEQEGVEEEATVEAVDGAAADTAMAAALRAGGVVDEESTEAVEAGGAGTEAPETAEAEADAEAEAEVAAAAEVEDQPAEAVEEEEPAEETAAEAAEEEAQASAEAAEEDAEGDGEAEDESAEAQTDSVSSGEREGEPEATAGEPAQTEGDDEEKKG